MDATPPLDDAAVLWSGPADDRDAIVLLHGYGSDERDLFGLVPHLPPGPAYAAVRAPLSPPWPAPGHSWYPIEGLDGRDTSRISAAAERLLDWCDLALSTARSIGLIGFSQGGAVSIQAMRLQPERFRFAANLSGYADPAPLATDAALAERRPPVFWGRGSADEVIPAPLVDHTTTWLPAHSDLVGRIYPGIGHSVSGEELGDLVRFIERELA